MSSRNVKPGSLRPVTIQRDYTDYAEGSVLISVGNTRVLCNASVSSRVPEFLKDSGQGWVTAEYAMLPRSTTTRSSRESLRGKPSGRTLEISRLIGRSLRCAVDLKKLAEYSITIDCDVIQADGGTRCASITGGMVALVDAIRWLRSKKMIDADPLRNLVAAVSAGIVDGIPVLDLCYEEDCGADVDMNIVMTDDKRFVELQGTAENRPFSELQLSKMKKLAASGIGELIRFQKKALRIK